MHGRQARFHQTSTQRCQGSRIEKLSTSRQRHVGPSGIGPQNDQTTVRLCEKKLMGDQLNNTSRHSEKDAEHVGFPVCVEMGRGIVGGGGGSLNFPDLIRQAQLGTHLAITPKLYTK